MRPQDIKIGESYRHKETPWLAWAKALEILKPKQGINTKTYTIIKCHYSVDKGGDFGLIKYFKASDLVRADK